MADTLEEPPEIEATQSTELRSPFDPNENRMYRQRRADSLARRHITRDERREINRTRWQGADTKGDFAAPGRYDHRSGFGEQILGDRPNPTSVPIGRAVKKTYMDWVQYYAKDVSSPRLSLSSFVLT